MSNYLSLSIHERINFKSWRVGAGQKLFKHDITEFWDSDMMWNAKHYGEFPLTKDLIKHQNAIMRRKYSWAYK